MDETPAALGAVEARHGPVLARIPSSSVPARIPLSPDLRAIGSSARIPGGDARDTKLHDPGGLAPMPIRKLPEPPQDFRAWRALKYGIPGVLPARRRRPAG